ncbi:MULTISPECIES: winged helix-turn-helix domain-containing protein [Micromonospora]|uniref:Winged helix-turn-helix transcriptional regulator n=1 Tax=Micromonospora antibiotica TaxID=2807623 RepID=A0ABS3VII4_9ACTN|nr:MULTISPECIES: winged helix-turn-helix domain-containing protein [Micromonospora]MBO4165417.1 winged helix-turn-helix transcriptional regulator [Micromonospora antibiotica]MBW4702292.1 winged helix-turn-helix transcriptional regulator [Micromonospora sp. RL09-050-HVF-A]
MPVKPKWQQLADQIRGQIESGELAPGDQLPSTMQLKTEHGVSTTVVRQAILVLQTQGWVQGVHGLGVFVAERE